VGSPEGYFLAWRASALQTEQVPPSFAQCLQYLQLLQARQVPVGLQVARAGEEW
jgi:hypothetical protein